jgi:hypothetical protein
VRVLVVGHERSATTWTGEVLGATAGSVLVSEPDDPRMEPFPVRAMAGLGTLPVLGAGDAARRDLIRLWDVAYGTRRSHFVRGQRRVSVTLLRSSTPEQLDRMQGERGRLTARLRVAAALGVPIGTVRDTTPEHRVVKSVHAPLMIEWIRARWDPVVVVCFRHPLDVVASAVAAGNLGRSGASIVGRIPLAARRLGTEHYGVPMPTDDLVSCIAWRVGLVMSSLAESCEANPQFHVVDHATTCEDPVRRLQELVRALGLVGTSETERFVTASNRRGSTFEPARVAREQQGRWRHRLSVDDAHAARAILEQFPVAEHYDLGA